MGNELESLWDKIPMIFVKLNLTILSEKANNKNNKNICLKL